MSGIPTIDLNHFGHEDPAVRRAACDALRVGFGEYGLAYLENHGVDLALRDELFQAFAAFTARPEEEKRKLSGSDIWFQRGWTPPNTERAVVAGGQPDFKECYFAAPIDTDPECQLLYPQIYAHNLWPDGADRFRELYLEHGAQLHRASLRVLAGCARALGVDADSFEQATAGGAHVTRLLRYLPLEPRHIEAGVVWGEEHTDFNVVTLLPGGLFLDPDGAPCDRPDDHAGLYLRTRGTADRPEGELVRGVAPKGCLVAQVGQQLEILSGGTFHATPHVITAPKKPGYSRMSGAHFVHLHALARVFPLEPFRTERALLEYSPPVLAGTYAMKTLVDIGLAPPETLERLGYRQYGRLQQIRDKKGSA